MLCSNQTRQFNQWHVTLKDNGKWAIQAWRLVLQNNLAIGYVLYSPLRWINRVAVAYLDMRQGHTSLNLPKRDKRKWTMDNCEILKMTLLYL